MVTSTCGGAAMLTSNTALFDSLIEKDRLLSYREIADRIGVSIHTVRGWVYKRQIPFLKAGKSVRFLWADVLSWLQKNGG